MPSLDVQTHLGYTHPPAAPDAAFAAWLTERRRQLDKQGALAREDAAWQLRSYPVLAVHTPVMTTQEGKIEYPGDPMCLYSALSLAVDQAVKARHAASAQDDPYNDVCPRWGDLPSHEYRFQAGDDDDRNYADPAPNTDQTVYAPGVWNEEVKHHFVRDILNVLQPRVVLISAVSPGHRYALDVARTVRRHLPDTLIVLGGRHADETMRYHDSTGQLDAAPSSTLQVIADGRAAPVIDFVLSGDGYFALDLLMKAISIAMDMERKTARVADVVRTLDKLATLVGPVPGQAVIAALEGRQVHIFPLRGRPFDLAELPSPYRAFAIRARFPIFPADDGSVRRTAHVMTVNACPYHCYYCSESAQVAGRPIRFICDPVQAALDRVFEYVSYGAEAMFFDDSIFCGGNSRLMFDFCAALAEAQLHHPENPWLRDAADWQRLEDLVWGAQLTVEFLTSLQSREKALGLLWTMRAAGCTYLYVGIESMSPKIMSKVHKNLHQAESPAWSDKVRAALLVAKEAGLRVGASVLFGLEGETRDTVDETIKGVARLLTSSLLYIASPNILTYHPVTEITFRHEMPDALDYHSLGADVKPPYSYFEEAFPQVVSKELTEDDIWYIYRQTRLYWSREIPLDPFAVHPDSVRDVWGAPQGGKADHEEPPALNLTLSLQPLQSRLS
jgi:radical SAM superfamily enzyme YgiQ (UPF0313 family)